jgi:hypothetical protein
LLVLPLAVVEASRGEAELLDGSIANALHKSGRIEVMTRDDLARFVDLEADKQAIGCDVSSCLMEIADALTARYVVYGKLGKLGEIFVVQLSMFDSAQKKPIAREEVRASSIEGVLGKLDVAVARIAAASGAAAAAVPRRDSSAGARFRDLRERVGGVTVDGLGKGLVVGGTVAAGVTSGTMLLTLASVVDPVQTTPDSSGVTGGRPVSEEGVYTSMGIATGVGAVIATAGAVTWLAGDVASQDLRREGASLRGSLASTDAEALDGLAVDDDAARWWTSAGSGLIGAGAVLILANAVAISTADGNLVDQDWGATAGFGQMGVGGALVLSGAGLIAWGVAQQVDVANRADDFAEHLGEVASP